MRVGKDSPVGGHKGASKGPSRGHDHAVGGVSVKGAWKSYALNRNAGIQWHKTQTRESNDTLEPSINRSVEL